MTEEMLLQGCLAHDATAQQELYHRFSPKMLSVCYRYAKAREDAEDMLQEGFIKVFSQIDKYENRGSLEGWIRRIAVNTSLNKIRARRQTETLEPELHDTEIGDDALNRLETIELLEMISRLPEGYRMVFNLYAVEG